MNTTAMTFYLFTCSQCAAEFDVARPADDLSRPATCPLDGAPARRAFGPPSATPHAATTANRLASWGGYMHDHGPGTEMHWHGASSPGSA